MHVLAKLECRRHLLALETWHQTYDDVSFAYIQSLFWVALPADDSLDMQKVLKISRACYCFAYQWQMLSGIATPPCLQLLFCRSW